MTPLYAPAPDFRYVGLSHREQKKLRTWAGIVSVAGAFGASAALGLDPRHFWVATTAALAAGGAVLAARALTRTEAARPIAMAIVPWGVLIEEEASPRVLFWSAVKNVHVETRHGRDAGVATSLFSEVTVETEDRAWSGQTAGAAPLERLLAYLTDYADEQSHPIAYDLDGEVRGEGPYEPDCEPLLESARAFVESAEGSDRLGLPPMSYRSGAPKLTSDKTIDTLRTVLRSRETKSADPRAFAAALAAELSASELAPDLTALVQCPHPLVAAVAKQAARKLGVSTQRVGALDEIRPFLRAADADQLAAWAP
jgi:hypothetical protein